MKIAFIGQKGIPAVSGGVEKHVEDLATRLVLAGHEVLVYVRPNYTKGVSKEYRGVKLINLPTIGTKHLDAITHTFLACLDIFFRKVDIVHFHSIGPSTLIWLVKILKPKTPIVATFHTQCYHHQKWGAFARFYLKMGERAICSLPDKTITVSKVLTNYVHNNYNGSKVEYIPNGVLVEKINSANEIARWKLEKDKYIVAISRLVRHKGLHHLIHAYNHIVTDKKLVIVGDGSFTDDYVVELHEMANKNSNIIFVGNQTGNTLKELLYNAYLFVQPSESEGLSIALLEAMAAGKPVLVSDIPENLEPIKNVGFIFENKNVNSLKEQLLYILKNPELARVKGLAGIKIVENEYNWNVIMKNVEEIYLELIKKKHFFVFGLVKRFISLFL